MNKDLTITSVLTQLQGAGMKGKWNVPDPIIDNCIDGMLELTWADYTLNFYVEVKSELREYQLPKIIELAKKYQPFMVISGRIFPNLKEKLRENQIGYLDGAGNIFVQYKDKFIWLDGKKMPEKVRPTGNRAFTKTGLRTVFYLLWKKGAINLPHRILAKKTGVALGNIKNVILGLQQAGFVLQLTNKEMALQNKRVLLDRWMAGYKEILKPALFIGRYKLNRMGDFIDLKSFPIQDGETVWGGEPAAELISNYLNPKVFTVYSTELRGMLMQKWKLIPDKNGRLEFYEKFWQDEEHTALAPTLLVYADLMITDEPRNKETAERIYNEHLKSEYE